MYYWWRGSGRERVTAAWIVSFFCAQVCLEQKFGAAHLVFQMRCRRSSGVRVVLARSTELCRQPRVWGGRGGLQAFGENICTPRRYA